MKEKWESLHFEILCSINSLVNGEYGLGDDVQARLLQSWYNKERVRERVEKTINEILEGKK